MISRALIVLLGVTALGGCFEDVDLDAACPPDSPGCEAYDYDGDGVANAEDDFPEDADCALRDDDNCAACGVGCVAPQVCDGQGGCSCSDPKFSGASCDACADPTFAGMNCDACADPTFTGTSCDECADPTFTGTSCDECADPTFTGTSCDECADPTFTGTSCDECADPTFTGTSCDECADPTFTGTSCDECADPHYALPECTSCLPQYTGTSCDECADPHYALPECTSCLPEYTGTNCDACADPTYTGASCDECADPTYNGPDCAWYCDNGLVGPNCDEVIIPAGTFTMGSPGSEPCRFDEEVQHQVTLTQSFALKATEVTQAEWEALMGNNPSEKSPGCDECPVETVNWYEALAYCNALSASAGLEACYTLSGCTAQSPGTNMTCTGVTVTAPDGDVYGCEGYRLPTEAEWEYAARAGTTEATYNGDIASGDCYLVSPVLEPIAWYGQNSGFTTNPVAQKDANPWGLYDMLGNVWEWTWDKYGSYDNGASQDPTGASSGSVRVYRGCGWATLNHATARRCRAAVRDGDTPERRYAVVGFRPARSLP